MRSIPIPYGQTVDTYSQTLPAEADESTIDV